VIYSSLISSEVFCGYFGWQLAHCRNTERNGFDIDHHCIFRLSTADFDAEEAM